MRARRVSVVAAGLVLAALLVPSCGGDNGQGPSAVVAPPAVLGPVTLNIISGETQAPVAAARVAVGGTEYVADAEGRVTLPGGLSAAAAVDVVAAGFLDRQTLLSTRGIAGPLTLWPRQSPTGLTERFTEEVVYTSSAIGEEPVAGGVALHRWADGVSQVGVVYLGPGDGAGFLAFDARALAVQQAAVDEINHALGGRIGYGAPRPGPAPAGGAAQVLLRIHPSFAPCVASPANWGVAELSEGAFTTATITYCREEAAREFGLSVHEFGHTVGLRHSSRSSDVMAPFARRTERLSDRERVVTSLMLQRPSGNRFPDSDRAVRTSARAPRVLGCGR